MVRQTITYADYRPYGAARELFRQRGDEILVSGPAGTGKSRGCLEKVHAIAEKYPGSRQLIVRKTRVSLSNTTLITFRQLVLPPDMAERITKTGIDYPNGSRIDFGGLDKASKIMSSDYDLAYVPEATELTEDDWESITTRLRWGALPYQQLIADCNPAHPQHWLKRRTNTGQTLMLESRHEDNPALYDATTGTWTPKGVAYIRKLDKLTGARYLRLRKGIWAAAEGMIFDGWDPAVHMVNAFKVPQSWPRLWVVDFGFEHAFVFQCWAIDPDGRMFLVHQICRTHRIVQDHAQDIRNACLGEPYPIAIVCDHDAEDRATLERWLGLWTVPAYKAVSPGIQAVQQRLRNTGDRPRLFVLRDSLVSRDEELAEAHRPTCLEEEIEGYVWAQGVGKGAGRPKDVPVKKDDDNCDAMRYAVAFMDNLRADPSQEISAVTFDARYQISPV